MESKIILDIFKRSEEKNNLIYNRFVGDGDSSVENFLVTSRIYADVVTHKIECKNHLIRNFAKHLETSIKTVNSKDRQPLQHLVHKITRGVHWEINNSVPNIRTTNAAQILEEET